MPRMANVPKEPRTVDIFYSVVQALMEGEATTEERVISHAADYGRPVGVTKDRVREALDFTLGELISDTLNKGTSEDSND